MGGLNETDIKPEETKVFKITLDIILLDILSCRRPLIIYRACFIYKHPSNYPIISNMAAIVAPGQINSAIFPHQGVSNQTPEKISHCSPIW